MKHPTNNEIWYAEQRDLAIEERDAAIARAKVAEAEVATLRARVAELDRITAMACSDGNWNYDSYLHGMANAFLIALATMKNEDYTGLPAPEKWLSRYERATDIKLRAEIAALEAAARWHPASEPPGEPGEYLGWDGYQARGVDYFPEQYTDWPWYDDLGIEIPVTHWRPLTEPSQEAPAA